MVCDSMGYGKLLMIVYGLVLMMISSACLYSFFDILGCFDLPTVDIPSSIDICEYLGMKFLSLLFLGTFSG